MKAWRIAASAVVVIVVITGFMAYALAGTPQLNFGQPAVQGAAIPTPLAVDRVHTVNGQTVHLNELIAAIEGSYGSGFWGSFNGCSQINFYNAVVDFPIFGATSFKVDQGAVRACPSNSGGYVLTFSGSWVTPAFSLTGLTLTVNAYGQIENGLAVATVTSTSTSTQTNTVSLTSTVTQTNVSVSTATKTVNGTVTTSTTTVTSLTTKVCIGGVCIPP